MADREFQQGQIVSITLPNGTIDAGWKIFMIKIEQKTAIIVREGGADIESKEVPLDQLT